MPSAVAERVLRLHGLWMPGAVMMPLARRLRAAGFAPEVCGYFAAFGTRIASLFGSKVGLPLLSGPGSV